MEIPQIIFGVALDTSSLTLVETYASSRGLAVESHPSLDAFLRAWRTGGAGCIVLDLKTAGEDGLTALPQLQHYPVLLPVVLIAEHPTAPLAVRAMHQGAAWLFEKPLTRESLEPVLDDVLQREQKDRQARRLRETTLARIATLTEGERDVLQRLMAGMANKNIAADLQLGLRTVELRRAKILKKLGARSLAEMVRLVVLADPTYAYGEISSS